MRVQYAPGSLYQWWFKYGGIDASLMHRLKELEEEPRLQMMCDEERIKSLVRRVGLEGRVKGRLRDARWSRKRFVSAGLAKLIIAITPSCAMRAFA